MSKLIVKLIAEVIRESCELIIKEEGPHAIMELQWILAVANKMLSISQKM